MCSAVCADSLPKLLPYSHRPTPTSRYSSWECDQWRGAAISSHCTSSGPVASNQRRVAHRPGEPEANLSNSHLRWRQGGSHPLVRLLRKFVAYVVLTDIRSRRYLVVVDVHLPLPSSAQIIHSRTRAAAFQRQASRPVYARTRLPPRSSLEQRPKLPDDSNAGL